MASLATLCKPATLKEIRLSAPPSCVWLNSFVFINSSNTTHLQEISIERGLKSYHIDSADRIGPGNQVEHQPLTADLVTESPWLPAGHLTIGITSGASTPDKVVEDIIEKLFAIKNAEAS